LGVPHLGHTQRTIHCYKLIRKSSMGVAMGAVSINAQLTPKKKKVDKQREGVRVNFSEGSLIAFRIFQNLPGTFYNRTTGKSSDNQFQRRKKAMQALWLEEYRQSDTHGILCYKLALQMIMKLPKKFNVWTVLSFTDNPRARKGTWTFEVKRQKEKDFVSFSPFKSNQVQSTTPEHMTC